jgi:hypothetical protein
VENQRLRLIAATQAEPEEMAIKQRYFLVAIAEGEK